MSDKRMNTKPGRLVCIGTGICHAEQITLVARTYLQRADVVYGVMPNSVADDWIRQNNPNYVNMQKYYAQGKPRTQTYMDMAQAMLEEVRAGKDVCCALYGHPGVMANIAHLAVGLTRQAGFAAKMEPGVSAEDCLFADLGLDPCYHGCTSHEVTQLMFTNHTVDPNAVLILWQISLAAEHTLTKFNTTSENLQLTVDFLSKWYDLDHEVIIYEAAFLPGHSPRIERLALKDLPDAELKPESTLVILPKERADYNKDMLARFGVNESDLGNLG
jgi:precorrin-3B methylase